MALGTTTDTDGARSQDRGVARRQAFLQAAREVFLEQGYEAASVNDVVRRAGGSLATLYAQFGNKEGLFLAVTQDQHERFTRAMTPSCADHNMSLEDGLQYIGVQFVTAMLARDNLAFFRVITSEGRKFPEQMRRYLATGGEKVRGVVAQFLKEHNVRMDDPDAYASFLVELWRSRHHYHALADDTYRLTDAEIKTHVERAVRFFLNGALPR
jgi:AcrR family transcriptional regulator